MAQWTPPTPEESTRALLEQGEPGPAAAFRTLAQSGLYQAMPAPGPNDWLNGPGVGDRPGQKLCEWPEPSVAASLQQSRTIVLVPLGDCPEVDGEALARVLRAFYHGMTVEVAAPSYPDKVTSRASRGFGTQLLCKDLHEHLRTVKRDRKAFVAVGFTMFDLYPKAEWNFVFGQANADRGTGVFSFARYNDSPTPTEFFRRCVAVLCHEVGHLFRIKHCIWWQCLMNGSNGDWESKSRACSGRGLALCPTDLAKLHEALGFDLQEREAALAAALEAVGLPEQAAFHAQQGSLLAAEPPANLGVRRSRRQRPAALQAALAAARDGDAAVKYVDTDGDTIEFRRKATGKLDCHANGAPYVVDLTSLELRNGTIYLDGTSAVTWQKTTANTTPANSSDAERVLALYSGNFTDVKYVDMDGDTIVFRRWATGKLDYHVNGAPKVIDLTSLELQDGRTIFLDGTSAGSWPSNRCTTPVNSSDAERVLALYNDDSLRVPSPAPAAKPATPTRLDALAARRAAPAGTTRPGARSVSVGSHARSKDAPCVGRTHGASLTTRPAARSVSAAPKASPARKASEAGRALPAGKASEAARALSVGKGAEPAAKPAPGTSGARLGSSELSELEKAKERLERAAASPGQLSAYDELTEKWNAFQAKFNELNRQLVANLAQGLAAETTANKEEVSSLRSLQRNEPEKRIG